MTLGNRIRLFREKCNLTQKELANRVGVTTGIIAEWEADETTPNLSELAKLCKALSVSSDVFLETVSEENYYTEVKIETNVSKRQQQAKIFLVSILVILIGVAILVLCILRGFLTRFPEEKISATVDTEMGFEEDFAADDDPLVFSEDPAAIELADGSVVTIFCYDHEGVLSATGSGFVAFDGCTVITNYHVMTSAYTCRISTNQDISYDVSNIICYSQELDVAVLKLAKDTDLEPLDLGDSSVIKKGEPVVAIGSPLGIKNTVSTGVLSGRLMEGNVDILQFTAPISSGSSGGALFDNNGSVIGITYATIIDGQNLNLAIPIEVAINLYEAKGSEQGVSTIYLEEHPQVEYMLKYRDYEQVTITELKENAKEYDDKQILVQGVVWNEGDFFYIVDKAYYDRYPVASINKAAFEETPYVYVIRGIECEFSPEELSVGQEVIIIGKLDYQDVGESYKSAENGKIVSLTRTESYAALRANVVYYP